MFSNLLLHRVQAFLDIVPADVNVCCVQPVVVDRDRIFLSTNTIDNAILTAATLHNIQQIFILSIFMTFMSTVTVKLVPALHPSDNSPTDTEYTNRGLFDVIFLKVVLEVSRHLWQCSTNYGKYDKLWMISNLSVRAATPYHQESSCGWRKGEDRPLVRVIALYSLWQGGYPDTANKKPIPLTPEVLFRNRQRRRTGGSPGKMAVKQKWFHS